MRDPRFFSKHPVLRASRALATGIGLALLFTGVLLPGSGRAMAQETPQASATAAPTPKARPYPFKSVVFSVDAPAGYFRMGKRRIRQVFVVETSKLRHDDGRPATLADLSEGIEIRGSIRKRANGDLEAVTVIIGTHVTPIPGE